MPDDIQRRGLRLVKVAVVSRAWFPNHQVLLERVQRLLEEKGIKLVYVLLSESESGRPWHRVESTLLTRVVAGRQYSIMGKEIMINWGIAQALDEISPSVVVVTPWSEIGSFLAKSWALKRRVPCIGWVAGPRTFHWKLTMVFRGYYTHWLVRHFVRGMSELFAYGRGVALTISGITGYPSDKIVNVKHCIDESLYSFASEAERMGTRDAMRTRLSIPRGALVFGFVGQLTERKGIGSLLSACAKLWDQGEDFLLFVLGQGPLQCTVDELASKFPGRIVQLYRVAYSELRDCYALVDCMVVPSLFDDWSTVVNEAFCAAVPVVASTGAFATRDLVMDSENGFVYSPEVHEGLINRLRLAILQRERLAFLGKSGNRLVTASWNMNVSARIWADRLTFWAGESCLRSL